MTAVLSIEHRIPELTLGWDVLEWSRYYIRQPDGPDAGGSWAFTDEQALFILVWYELTPDGRFRWTRGVLRRPKGWGKSPTVGALALVELCGPVRFGGWATGLEEQPWWRSRPYLAGEPMAVPAAMPWVQLCGVSERQTVNTMSVILAMVAESPIRDDYGLDVGITRIFTASSGRLEPITASAPTAEGARPTFVIEDETHHWTASNGGLKLDQVNRRNLGKSRDGMARALETTNAHEPGGGSVAERSFLAWQASQEGRSRHTGILYDAREAPAETDLSDEASLTAGLRDAYGDSAWVDLQRIRDEIWDPGTPPEDSRRFYLNQLSAASDSWLTELEVKGAIAKPDVATVEPGEAISLGFDGSEHRERGFADATALVGCRISDGHTFLLGVWEQPEGVAGKDWEVPVVAVDATVRMAFETYGVVGFYADPSKWRSYIDTWEVDFGANLPLKASARHPIYWYMTGGRAMAAIRATKGLHDALVSHQATICGSPAMIRHLLNARRRTSINGVQIAKAHPESRDKIDVAVAAVLAFEARTDARAAGLTGTTKRRSVFGFH